MVKEIAKLRYPNNHPRSVSMAILYGIHVLHISSPCGTEDTNSYCAKHVAAILDRPFGFVTTRSCAQHDFLRPLDILVHEKINGGRYKEGEGGCRVLTLSTWTIISNVGTSFLFIFISFTVRM